MVKDDRVELHGLFKALVYADSLDDFEEKYESLMESIITTYPNFGRYMESVCDYKEEWSICYRKVAGVLTRGHHTNNNAEAQFLVLKEYVLCRVKAWNMNELFDKLTVELEEHYMEKLLSIATGSFDMFVSRRYAGKKVKVGEIGFSIPSSQQKLKMMQGVQSLGNRVYLVPSCSDSSLSYSVDMALGLCGCFIGMDGSPCKHQYVLWYNKVDTCPNFLPFFSPSERMHAGTVATGRALPLHMYEGVHDRTNPSQQTSILCTPAMPDAIDGDDLAQPGEEEGPSSPVIPTNDNNLSSAKETLELAFQNLLSHVDNADSSYCKALKVFADQTGKLNPAQLTTALQKFGKPFWSAKRNAAHSVLKRAQRCKIGVQPSAVIRRKSKGKGRKALPVGKVSELLPVKTTAKKRKHDLAGNVRQNLAQGVTHSQLMKSKCPPTCKKIKEAKVKREKGKDK